MTWARVFPIVVAGLTVACLAFAVVLLVIKALWAWTIPDLFPGAVAQGLVAGTISWLTAMKVAILVAVLSGISGGAHVRAERR
jgi:hypothetical protein